MSFFQEIPEAPADPIFALTTAFKADPAADKINVGVGAYRTDDGKPWVLPVVQEAKKRLLTDPSAHHEYLPMSGYEPLNKSAAKLIFGEGPTLQRVASVQAISGTGALRLFGELAKKFKIAVTPDSGGRPRILLPTPTWPNHNHLFATCGFDLHMYPYLDSTTMTVDIDKMIDFISKQNPGTAVLLHGCAHNPTGVDPTKEEWKRIGQVIKEKRLLPLFDIAYQGFATGDLDKDAWAIRYFVNELGLECFVAQSFSKNFGLYGERCGCLHAMTTSPEIAAKLKGQMARESRALVSNCPSFGAKIVATVLEDPSLYAQWQESLRIMSGRILKMRQALVEGLQKHGTPGNWSHITRQIGMFSFTGLTKEECTLLKNDHHIYMTQNGRISLAGLNTGNLDRFVKAVDTVVRQTRSESSRL